MFYLRFLTGFSPLIQGLLISRAEVSQSVTLSVCPVSCHSMLVDVLVLLTAGPAGAAGHQAWWQSPLLFGRLAGPPGQKSR